ncbi:MAG: PIN domain-containing protein, partial [Candidatus Altiarchaeota archaeon]|nr:PIN domain-containing protein [Candidatus Altiarchaeota archaeon]
MQNVKIVPDTSVIVNGKIKDYVKHGCTVIVPNAVVAELEFQANYGRETGLDGLRELELLQKRSEKEELSIAFHGPRPTADEIRNAKAGMIDELVRKAAQENDAVLVTSDAVQSMVAKAKGIKVEYVETPKTATPKIFELFDRSTMSVHLKEN